TAEDGVVPGAFRDHAARALGTMVPVMGDPGLAEDLPAEAALPLLAVPPEPGVLRPLARVEGGRGRAYADDGLSRIGVLRDELHLVVRQLPEACEDDHEVRGTKSLE